MPRHSVYDAPPTAKPSGVDRGDILPLAPEVTRASGPAAAVVLAAGLASFALGLLSVLTASSASASSALTVSDRTGDLSGVTVAAAAIFFPAGGVVGLGGRPADPPLVRVGAAAAVLAALGLLGTFPPVFNLIAG
jgi:hypothetical protein